jgi:hypothetical protein
MSYKECICGAGFGCNPSCPVHSLPCAGPAPAAGEGATPISAAVLAKIPEYYGHPLLAQPSASQPENRESGETTLSNFDNGLSKARTERLAIAAEECGEAIMAIGKILRHGLHSWNPNVVGGGTNQDDLARELGDVTFAISMLVEADDVSGPTVYARAQKKAEKIKPYLHHQSASPAPESSVSERSSE